MKNTTLLIIIGIVIGALTICFIADSGGVHNTPHGTVFCKNKIHTVFHDQATIITEDDIAFYATKDGKDGHLVALAEKECK